MNLLLRDIGLFYALLPLYYLLVLMIIVFALLILIQLIPLLILSLKLRCITTTFYEVESSRYSFKLQSSESLIVNKLSSNTGKLFQFQFDDFENDIEKDSYREKDIEVIPKVPKKLCAALVEYYRVYSNSNIPKNFIVPSDGAKNSWPKWLQGYHLGSAFKIFVIGNDVGRISVGGSLPAFKLTDAINSSFILPTVTDKPRKKYNTYNFTDFISAVSLYKTLNNGSLVIPKGWTVPCCDPWPQSCWKMKLGVKVTAVRSGRLYRRQAQQSPSLGELGFVWDPSRLGGERLQAALGAFRRLHGHVDVPRDFVVPPQEPFHRDAWGMKLGLKVGNMRYRGDREELARRLQGLGLLAMDKAGFDTRHWDEVLRALHIYRDRCGHVNVPQTWAVPEGQEWPQELWGLKLGYRVHNIRYRGDFVNQREECRQLLDDLGFRWKKFT